MLAVIPSALGLAQGSHRARPAARSVPHAGSVRSCARRTPESRPQTTLVLQPSTRAGATDTLRSVGWERRSSRVHPRPSLASSQLLRLWPSRIAAWRRRCRHHDGELIPVQGRSPLYRWCTGCDKAWLMAKRALVRPALRPGTGYTVCESSLAAEECARPCPRFFLWQGVQVRRRKGLGQREAGMGGHRTAVTDRSAIHSTRRLPFPLHHPPTIQVHGGRTASVRQMRC